MKPVSGMHSMSDCCVIVDERVHLFINTCVRIASSMAAVDPECCKPQKIVHQVG